MVAISSRRAQVIRVGARLKSFRRRGERVWISGRIQSVFPIDLNVQVRNALRGIDRKQDQEIPPRRLVGA